MCCKMVSKAVIITHCAHLLISFLYHSSWNISSFMSFKLRRNFSMGSCCQFWWSWIYPAVEVNKHVLFFPCFKRNRLFEVSFDFLVYIYLFRIWIKHNVMEQIDNYAVSPEIFLEKSSFMKWWGLYEGYIDTRSNSHSSPLISFMKNRSYRQYG